MIKNKPVELSNLDTLRALAIFFVVFDHIFKFMGHQELFWFNTNNLGLLGVSFFFVHTALVLMFSLERHEGRHKDWKLFVSFYIRRILRIYPISILFLLFIVLFKIPSGRVITKAIIYNSPNLQQIMTNIFLVQNLAHHPSIIRQYWSLPIEIQMYFILPFLFLMLSSSRRIRLLSLLWLGSVALTYAGFMHRKFDIIQHIPNFLSGVIAYVIFTKVKPRLPAWSFFGFVIALVFIYTLFQTIICGWVVCLLLGIGIPFFHQFRNNVIVGLYHQIAKYSYGIYISHIFCIWVAFCAFSFFPTIMQFTLFLLMLICLPCALYYCVERPGIQLGVKLSNRFLDKYEK